MKWPFVWRTRYDYVRCQVDDLLGKYDAVKRELELRGPYNLWIDPTLTKPANRSSILIYDIIHEVAIGFYDTETKKWYKIDSDGETTRLSRVTHWMHLYSIQAPCTVKIGRLNK